MNRKHTPDSILGMAWSIQKGRLLLTGAELDIFTMLTPSPQSVEDVTEKLEGSLRGVTIFLDALTAMGLLIKKGGLYQTEASAASLLSANEHGSVLPMVKHIAHLWETWSGLTDIVRNKTAKKGKGISAFAIEKGTPGFTIGKAEDKMGHRASPLNELIFDNCRIPKECLLGQEGEGFRIAMMELDGGRIGIGSLAVGIGFGAIDFAAQYVKEREAFGQPLSRFQAIQWMIADSYTELEAAQLLVLRAAFLKENKLKFTKEASMAKLFATETARRVAIRAVQMLGGYGYTRDYPVERYLRDVIGTTLYEGTSEVQRIVVAREILKQR